jgi:exonuclease SbcD
MKPIALLMNDLHIAKDNVLEYEKNWNEALKICEEYNIKQIYIGGDVFTTRNVQHLAPVMTVLRCLDRTISKGIETTIAFGNHDCPVYGEKDNWCDVLCRTNGVEVVNNIMVTDLGDKVLAMIAYFPEETMMEDKLKELDAMLDGLHISYSDVVLYIHAGVHGALGNFDVPNEMPQEPLLKYYKVLCAHYHNRTVLEDTNIEYIGSSRAHTFGEDEEKGYTLLYPDGETSFVKNEVNTRYVTEDVMLKNLPDWENVYDERYKIRLRIHCQAAEADTIDKSDLIARGANKIEFVTEKLQAIENSQSEMDERFDNKNLQIEYQSFCKEKDIDSRFGIDYLTKVK